MTNRIIHADGSLLNFPDLCAEWDYVTNSKGPECYSYGSSAKVAWICKINPCGCHKWLATIDNRIVYTDNSGKDFRIILQDHQVKISSDGILILPNNCLSYEEYKSKTGIETYGSFYFQG